jgi:hypothetical protein
MASPVHTAYGNVAGPNDDYKFRVEARLYVDNILPGGWTVHWEWKVFVFRWAPEYGNTTLAYAYNNEPTPHGLWIPAGTDWTNVSICEVKGMTATVPFGGSISTVAAAEYTDWVPATFRSALSTTYTVPRPTYTVAYDANGGSGAPASQTATYGIPLTLSTTVPTRSGFRFDGWLLSGTNWYQPGDSITLS